MAQSFKPGQVFQSKTFPSMKAIIAEELQPGFYAWYLARPAKGGYVRYGFARYSEIDLQVWEPKS